MDRLLQAYVSRMIRDEEGQTVIEYALILAFVAAIAVALGATGTLTTAVEGAIDEVEGLF